MNSKPDLLPTWLAEEAAALARLQAGAGVGIAPLAHVAQQSGLAFLQGMLAGQWPSASMGQTLNFCLIEVAAGRAVFQGRPSAEVLNPMGGVHGGWFASLLDSALGCAVHSMLPAGRAYSTAQLNLHLVKAISPQLPRVRAQAQTVHVGRQMATAEAQLLGPDGTLYAHASTTCALFDLAQR